MENLENAGKTTFLGREYDILPNKDCLFLITPDRKIPEKFIKNDSKNFNIAILSELCRKVLTFLEIKKINGKLETTELPYFFLLVDEKEEEINGRAQLAMLEYPFYCDLSICFTINEAGKNLEITIYVDGAFFYSFTGNITAFTLNSKKSKIKRLLPEKLEKWRKDGFRPMFFKNRIYMMLEGEYLPNISEDNSIDLQSLSSILADFLDAYGEKDVQRILEVKVEKNKLGGVNISASIPETSPNDLFIYLQAKGQVVRITAFGDDGHVFRNENGLISFLVK